MEFVVAGTRGAGEGESARHAGRVRHGARCGGFHATQLALAAVCGSASRSTGSTIRVAMATIGNLLSMALF